MSHLLDSHIILRNVIENQNGISKAIRVVDKDIITFMEGVEGVVEATDLECEHLYNLNADSENRRNWRNIGGSFLVTVGHICDLPVCISLRTARIDYKKILFFYPTSGMVSYDMIREWFEINLPETAKGNYPGGYNHTDATNFHNIFPRC